MAYSIRLGGPPDIPVLIAHRRAMFIDMGMGDDPAALDDMSQRFAPWVEERLRDGSYLAWLVEAQRSVVAGAAVWMKEQHPGLRGAQSHIPYVLNVYTEPAHRGRGLARRLMETIVAWAGREGHPLVELHASDDGRPLYESMGFTATNEMRLLFK